jgi:hypothetical protein
MHIHSIPPVNQKHQKDNMNELLRSHLNEVAFIFQDLAESLRSKSKNPVIHTIMIAA